MFETTMTVVGRVITDIQQRTTQNGDRMCFFRIVATERRYNKEKEEWFDGNKLFIQVKCWRRLAENVGASLFKGDPVMVTGRVYLNEYELNGEPRSMLELDAQAVGPNLAQCTAMINRAMHDRLISDEPITRSAVAA
jgi:single-strand DNA-binding protein